MQHGHGLVALLYKIILWAIWSYKTSCYTVIIIHYLESSTSLSES